MRKIFTLLLLITIFISQDTKAQIVNERYINFRELAAYEAQHPELFQPCATCPKKEGDRWTSLSNPNMPFPPGAIIKTSPDENRSNQTNQPPMVMAPSRAPAQTWLGHLDVGSIIPPDSHGAVGLNHVITATNNFIKVHNKVGGAQITQVTISAFTGVSSSCDPYMKFDPATQRWIFSAIGCGASVNNLMILAVSNTSDPGGGWRIITWVPTGGPMFLDHPYLGFDDQWIVLSGRRFQGGSSFVGSSLFLVDKTAMLAGTPITWGSNAQQIDKTGGDGDCPLPVTVYAPPVSNSGNPSPGTFYILQSWNSTSIRLTTVTGTIPGASWNTGSAVFPSGGTPWNAGNLGNFAEQMPPETRRLSANDARVSCGIMMNGKIWANHHIGLPQSGSDRVAVQWWQLDGAPGANFGNVLQRGRVGGNNPNEYKWFPSIAVNRDEDVLIGYTTSSNVMRVSAGYVTRQASTPANTTDDELVYKTGLDRYWKDFGSGRARWGDYSHTALDPSDNSLWTIQEYADMGAGSIPPDNNSRFGVWWAQVAPSAPQSGFTFSSPAPATSACPAGASMSVVLNVISIGGFTNPVTLSAAGNPGGTTVSFSANPVVPSASPGTPVTVTLNGTNTLTNGNHVVIITGTATGAPNQTVNLTYTINPGAGPTITVHPTSQTVCAPAPVTFSVTATGAIAYQWQSSIDGGTNYSNVSGATSSSYTIATTTGAMNNTMYRVRVSSQCNTITSNSAVLTVNSAPSISTQPNSQTLCAASNVTFTVAATGTGLTYQWQESIGAGPFNNIGGATSASYTLNNVTTGQSGNRYQVVVSGTCTPPATSTPATLTVVAAAAITGQPTDVTVCEPGITSFTATASSATVYQWQISTDGGTNYSNITNGGIYSGANTATLNISGTTFSMNGYRYRLQASNATCLTPATTNGVILTVNTVPSITVQPSNVTICAGSNNTFNVTASGTTLTYQWQLSTDGGTNYGNIAGATSSSYTVTGTTPAFNGYMYKVVVSGACTPPATSTPVTLTVHTPIAITTQPNASAVCATGSTSITVAATGTGPSYQWQVFDGVNWQNIANNATYSGAGTTTLTINNITATMNGTRYRNVVSGTAPCAAVISNETTLNVTPQPVISVSGPTSLLPGRSVSLSVPSGANLTYQWFLNGNTILGATSFNYTANVTQLGDYHVVVTSTLPGGTSCISAIQKVKDSASSKLFVFPSPNEGQYTVSFYNSTGASSSRTVTVYDSKGAQVYNAKFSISGPYTLMNIDMRRAQSGAYYVVLRDVAAKELARGRVVVQHR